jgi:hypothetical protein
MTTDVTLTATQGPSGTTPVVPPSWRVTEVVSAMATRLSFLAVAWVVLVDGVGLGLVVGIVAVATLAYVGGLPVAQRLLTRAGAGPVSVTADLASAVALGAAALLSRNTIGLMVAVAALGVLRAGSDLAKTALSGAAAPVTAPAGSPDPPVPSRDGLIGLLVAGTGAVIGAVATWLGGVAVFWLLSMLCVLAAARVALAAFREPTLAGQPIAEDGTDAWAERTPVTVPWRILATLAGTGLLAFTAAAVLVAVWARGVFQPAGTDPLTALGLLGSAFVVGAVAAGVALTAGAGRPLHHLLFGVGFLTGGAATALLAGLRPALLVVVVVAMLAGVAMASTAPVVGLSPVLMPSRVNGVATAAAYVGLPAGAAMAGWLVPRASVSVGVTVAAAWLLAAMLLPVLAHRTWQELRPALEHPVTFLRRHPRLSARLSVTLAYADGQWVAELRRGRALLGRRYLVNSAEALTMLSVLDVPALTDRVEQALASDKTEASRQVERLRTELAELETKLNGLNDMVDLSERGKPT